MNATFEAEWSEHRDGETFFVVAVGCPGFWKFRERSTWEVRYFTVPGKPEWEGKADAHYYSSRAASAVDSNEVTSGAASKRRRTGVPVENNADLGGRVWAGRTWRKWERNAFAPAYGKRLVLCPTGGHAPRDSLQLYRQPRAGHKPAMPIVGELTAGDDVDEVSSVVSPS